MTVEAVLLSWDCPMLSITEKTVVASAGETRALESGTGIGLEYMLARSTCGCQRRLHSCPAASLQQTGLLASDWLIARQISPLIGWQTTVGAVLLAGCQCRHGRHAASRISRPAAVATGAAVATACSVQQELRAAAAAPIRQSCRAGWKWKEEAEVAAAAYEGAGVQHGKQEEGLDRRVQFGAGQPSLSRAFRAGRSIHGQTGRAGQQQRNRKFSASTTAGSLKHSSNVIIFPPPIPAVPPSSASARQEWCQARKQKHLLRWMFESKDKCCAHPIEAPLWASRAQLAKTWCNTLSLPAPSWSIMSLQLVLGPPGSGDSVGSWG